MLNMFPCEILMHIFQHLGKGSRFYRLVCRDWRDIISEIYPAIAVQDVSLLFVPKMIGFPDPMDRNTPDNYVQRKITLSTLLRWGITNPNVLRWTKDQGASMGFDFALYAAKSGNVEYFEWYPNAKDWDYLGNYLKQAVIRGHLDFIKNLPNDNDKHYLAESALHHKQQEILDYFVENEFVRERVAGFIDKFSQKGNLFAVKWILEQFEKGYLKFSPRNYKDIISMAKEGAIEGGCIHILEWLKRRGYMTHIFFYSPHFGRTDSSWNGLRWIVRNVGLEDDYGCKISIEQLEDLITKGFY